ncbi:MAG: sigma-54-dependent Fis family transcriptional regulator [Candidatus Rokubacteria bacterium]|nr:sigma-54-dependent Fis family transcriptional regulator [Candidatus Rokubacteria bacterium]
MTSTPVIMLVDDDAAFRHVMAGELRRLHFEVVAVESGEEALRRIGEVAPDVVLLDLQLPGISGLDVLQTLHEQHAAAEVIMLTGHGSIDTAIESIRAGAFDYVVKPCPLDELEVRIQRATERQALGRRARLLERGLTPPDLGGSFVGDSPPFRDLLHLIDRVAPTDSTVLVTGETGSGKEMVAKLVHARSLRRARPFVVVECAALQESLLQSELFGHERGAFTGADRAKPGLFEVAHGGTIFLDEIGEVSQATQVKLLRVLDTSTFRHVGGTAEIRVDVRLLAATNRDLQAMVGQGLFREDLYYRLSTLTIRIPPLRERRGDVELLARHFVTMLNDRFGYRRHIGAAALAVLERHDWPGNVRELQHVIEAAMIVCEDQEIRPEHLPAHLRAPAAAAPAAASARAAPPDGGSLPTLEQMERAHIEAALRATGGHRGRAAAILGISERNLYRRIRDWGLSG